MLSRPAVALGVSWALKLAGHAAAAALVRLTAALMFGQLLWVAGGQLIVHSMRKESEWVFCEQVRWMPQRCRPIPANDLEDATGPPSAQCILAG